MAYERFIKYILSAHESNSLIFSENFDLTRDVQYELQRLAYATLAADKPNIQKEIGRAHV